MPLHCFVQSWPFLWVGAPSAIRTRDLLLRRTWAVVPRPVYTQVSGHAEVSASDCHYPWLSASSGTQRARDLLIRRFQCGRPEPFRSVRDLGRFTVHCSLESGFPRSRPSGWLPAWLPGNTGSRLRRPPTLSREFVRSTCLHPLAAARPGQDHFRVYSGSWSAAPAVIVAATLAVASARCRT